MNKMNYQKELEKILEKPETKGKKLLLHSCCAPCSSYCLVYLRKYFRITVFYYNPNITEKEEYKKRVLEEKRLIKELNEEALALPENEKVFIIDVIEGDYRPELFFETSRGLESAPEGGERCRKCFELRLKESARLAKAGGFDYFTSTLTISPLKNAELLNAVGKQAGESEGVSWLPSDFKKKEGYRKSVELSEKYGLYRQNYCGCVFSKRDALN